MKQEPFRAEISLLDPTQIELDRDEHGWLRLRLQGQVFENVQPVRCFTHTWRDQFISLCDAEGKEIGLIEEVEALSPPSRQMLEEELEKRYFVPEILRIHRLTSRYGVTSWQVETDRGRRDFQVQSRDDVRWLPQGLILITDIDGNRFRITSRSRLDPRSRAFLDLCL